MSRTMCVSFASGVVVEQLGESFAVLTPGRSDVLMVSGEAADVVRGLLNSGQTTVSSSPALEDLVSRGVVVSSVSRRAVLAAGGAGIGAGISLLALPGVAAASSEPGVAGSGSSGEWTIREVATFPVLRTFSIDVVHTAGLTIPDGLFATVVVSDPEYTFTVQWSATDGVFQPTITPDDERFPGDWDLNARWYGRSSTLRFNPGTGFINLTFTPSP